MSEPISDEMLLAECARAIRASGIGRGEELIAALERRLRSAPPIDIIHDSISLDWDALMQQETGTLARLLETLLK